MARRSRVSVPSENAGRKATPTQRKKRTGYITAMTATILDRIGNTPLVRLTRVAAGLPVPVYGKCEFLNPGGSVKDRIARAIVNDAESRGVLRSGMTLVEATAGNTGVGLALVAAVRGYKLVCVMPEKMCLDKRTSLAALGAEVIVTANAPPSDPRNFRRLAERLAAERGWFPTEQFTNPANPRIHERTTGPEIVAHSAVPATRCVRLRSRHWGNHHRSWAIPENSYSERKSGAGRSGRIAAGAPRRSATPGPRCGLCGGRDRRQ